uniref:Reticulon-like protein n=1 Tax=Ascaris lumbricoides TaxID=6252 RepID=A0A0M3IU39_ASCLU
MNSSNFFSVLDLIYWRDPKKSAVVLSVSIILLLIFAKFPLISVLSYLGLAVLGGTLGFRLYKIAEAQLKKSDGANPFQPYLEKELAVPQERVHQQVDVLIEHGQLIVNQLRRLFLIENITDSAKFGLLLWALTYVGSWFSGLCILLLVILGVFSIPKFYEVYQEPIDHNITIAKEHINNVTNTMNEKLPFLKKMTGTHEKTN